MIGQHESSTAKLFDQKAESWAAKYEGPLRSRLEVFSNAVQAHLRAGSSILDFGCGAGVLSCHLSAMGYSVTGMDISGQMIQSAKDYAVSRCQSTEFLINDLNGLSKAQRKWDAITASSVLEYLPDPKQSLEIFRQSVNGWAFITVPNADCSIRKKERRLRPLARLVAKLPLPNKVLAYFKYLMLSQNHFTQAEFRDLANVSGFDVVKSTYLRNEAEEHSDNAVEVASMILFVLKAV